MGPPAVTMSTRARFAMVEGANDQRGWSANGRVRKRGRPSPTLPSGPELTLAKADNRFVPVFVAATAAGIPRSEERRVGKECVRPFRSRGSQVHSKKKKTKRQTI